MYGNRDNDYFREALNNTDSYLYKKLCRSGPVLTFRLLASNSLDLRGGIAIHRIEPTPYNWSNLATGNESSVKKAPHNKDDLVSDQQE